MKTKISFSLFIGLCVFSLLMKTTFGYEYEDERRAKEKQQQIVQLKERIGESYKVLRNNSLYFYDSPNILSKHFYVTETEIFVIKDWISTNHYLPEVNSYYKVQFDSGKVAYVKAETFTYLSSLYKNYLVKIFSSTTDSASSKDNHNEDTNEFKEIKDRIGKRYWIDGNCGISFYNSPNLSSGEAFKIKDIKSFVIEDTVKLKSEFPAYAYKIKFDSGQNAYVGVKQLFVLYGDYLSEEDLEKKEQEKKRQSEERKAKLRDAIKASIGAKLSSNYKGNNIEQAYRHLVAKLPVKGEFETTGEYKKKLSSIAFNEIYAFKIDDDYSQEISYDPDQQQLKLDLQTRTILDPYYDKTEIISIKKVGEKVHSYIGTNAFGAKRVIKKFTGVFYGVLANKEVHSVVINMPREEAKRHKNTLKVLLICRVISDDIFVPVAFKGTYYYEPTFSSPTEISYDARVINVELLELWVYNYKTGKILEKIEYY